MTRREQWITVLVLGAIALLFLFRLGALGFFDPDEGRYAAIPSAMLQSGDYVVPYLQGFPYLEKPPLLYWLTAGTLRLFGHDEFAGRLPVALTGYLGVLAIFWLARRTHGLGVAWAAAALLALNTQWFIQSRFLTTDMVLAGLLTAGFCVFYMGFLTGQRRWYALFYACVALATLTKGFIGFVLPGMVVFLFILVTRRWHMFREIQLPLGAVIGAGVVVPWFALVQQRFPQFLHYFIFDQHIARYVAENAEHERPFWFFVPIVLIGFFPWIAYLPLVRRRDRLAWRTAHGSASDPPDEAARRAAVPLNTFLWLWFLVIFVFFSVSKGKLMSYILPAFPPLALIVATLVARAWRPDPEGDVARRLRAASLAVGVLWIVLAGTAVVTLPRLVVRDGRMNLSDVQQWPWVFGAVWGVGGVVVIAFTLMRRLRALVVAQAVVTVAFFVTMISVALAIEPYLNPKPLGVALARVVRPDDIVALYRIPQPSVEFYIGRPPKLIAFEGEYKFGIRLRPNPDLFSPDRGELDRLLASPRTVYFVADRDTFQPGDVTTPIELVAENTKRVVYRNRKP